MNNNANRPAKKQNNRKGELDILPLLGVLWDKIWMIILAAVIAGLGTFVVTKLTVKPTYRAGFSAYVNNAQTQTTKEYLTNSDILASHELVQTYSSILKSDKVLSQAADEGDIDLSSGELSSMVSTTIQQDTEIIYVYVVSEDKQLAYDLAYNMSKVSPGVMESIIEGSSMRVIDEPKMPGSRYKPSYIKFALLGALVGALLSAIYIIIRYFMDDTVKSELELEKQFGLPVVGLIPDVNEVHKSGSNYKSSYYEYSYGKSPKDQTEGGKDNG